MTFMTSVGLYELPTEEERVEIGLDRSKSRWTLTLALCCAARCIVGLSLSRNTTSEAALHVLVQANSQPCTMKRTVPTVVIP